ncbi:MAG: Poly-beta-1,6-N-acetyl-D-glucosamine N-deacetylase precursor [candidate division WS2 bacterium ADurb.Bin280]|uniref:Poly-beta-1,6-N-acetyl-D-glucosamine N-deacetylase n=1 Tax=candidate division WS2 bacterium ADurb.Bin280 TaxID=1852829 RepID=A0A1V5SD41_9BACT|nr:MAG: Poly-beta-1,6-N-acetyl-D-glucosamine N-deacetylase precursor [candidate division WS2 bacterium ADurb.Bin280]
MRVAKSSSFFLPVLMIVSAFVAVVLLFPPIDASEPVLQDEVMAQVTATATATPQAKNDQFQEIKKEIDAKVFMYHHIGPLPDKADDIRKGLTVSEQEFEQQIKYLSEQGYKIMSFAKLDEAILQKQLPQKVVVPTFDDGYDDNYNYALPILNKYGATGTFFIITGKIGKSEYVTQDQVKEIFSKGNEIGSHTVNHPSLDKYRGESLKNELIKSKETLEAITSSPVISFCYPAGKYNQQTIDVVKDAKYKYAVTTKSSLGVIDLENLFEIPRYRISSGRNIEAMLR